MVEYKYNKNLGVEMYNYNKIIDQLESMTPQHKVEFVERLCERNESLAFSICNSIEVTMMDKFYLNNEKKVQEAICQKSLT